MSDLNDLFPCGCHICSGKPDPVIIVGGHIARTFTCARDHVDSIEFVHPERTPTEWNDNPYMPLVVISAVSVDDVKAWKAAFDAQEASDGR